jgi:hypothetical protein
MFIKKLRGYISAIGPAQGAKLWMDEKLFEKVVFF